MTKKILLLFALLCSVSSIVMADEFCEMALKSGNEYFQKGDYKTALKLYNQLVNKGGCGANFGGAAAKIKECQRILQEEADFENCITISKCDYYLKTYPKGKHVAEVKQMRSNMLATKVVDPAEDDAAFAKCNSESTCEEYLKKYPRGRHVTVVLAMKLQFQEEREAIEAASRLEREKEAEKSAFMEIQKIEFANLDAKNKVLNDFGSTLYADEMKFLTPRIVYDGIYDLPEIVTFYCVLYDPKGELKTAPDSPTGYTFTNTLLVKPGEDNTFQMRGYGSQTTCVFVPGDYVYELWYQDSLIYQTPLAINDKGDGLTHYNWRKALKKCCDNPSQPAYKEGSYKGQVKGYERSGLGLYSWNQGAFYVGEWKAKYKDGTGIDIPPEGRQFPNCPGAEYFVGEFSGNVKSGMGRCYDKYGNLIYQGNFSNNAPTQEFPGKTDKSMKFECLDYSLGCYYVGETKNGKCHGKGMLIWRWQGEMWYGDFVDGERSGYGVFMPYEGEVSTGIWRGDRKQ